METPLSVGHKSLQPTFKPLSLDIPVRISNDMVAIQISGACTLQRQRDTLMEKAREHRLFFIDVPLHLAAHICVFCRTFHGTYLHYNLRMSGTDEHTRMAACPRCHNAHSRVMCPGTNSKKSGLVIDAQTWIIRGQDLRGRLKATPRASSPFTGSERS